MQDFPVFSNRMVGLFKSIFNRDFNTSLPMTSDGQLTESFFGKLKLHVTYA